MQIQLVIGEQDKRYLDNLLNFFEKNYMDKLEIFSFSSPEILRDYFIHRKADILLLDETFGIRPEEISGYGKAAYLCEDVSAESTDNISRISKYKKPNLIYKDILALYADSGSVKKLRSGSSISGSLMMVTSMSGGNGASTFAAALAKKYASRGKKVLYLNLEATGSSGDFFSGSGDYRFEDIIFALKSRRADVRLKMESCVRSDKSGVHFFEPCSTAMYMMELTNEDIVRILDVLGTCGDYEKIVIDMNFYLSKEFMEILSHMDQIILVQDGSETSNTKFQRSLQALTLLETQTKENVTGAMSVIYNRFSSSKSSSEIPNLHFPVLGKFPPIKHALTGEIVDYMLGQESVFEKL